MRNKNVLKIPYLLIIKALVNSQLNLDPVDPFPSIPNKPNLTLLHPNLNKPRNVIFFLNEPPNIHQAKSSPKLITPKKDNDWDWRGTGLFT